MVAALAGSHGRVNEAADALMSGRGVPASTATSAGDAAGQGRYADPGGRYEFLFQTLELTSSKGGTLIPVPDEFARHPLFAAFFGDGASAGMHCRVESKRKHCTRLEIVGHGVEAAVWKGLRQPAFLLAPGSEVVRQTYVGGGLSARMLVGWVHVWWAECG